jgi:hypothetical protein
MKKEKEEMLNCTFSLMANPEPEQHFLSYWPAKGGIFKHFRSPESIPWNRFCLPV